MVHVQYWSKNVIQLGCAVSTLVYMLCSYLEQIYWHNLQVWSFIFVTSVSIYCVNTTYRPLYLMNQAKTLKKKLKRSNLKVICFYHYIIKSWAIVQSWLLDDDHLSSIMSYPHPKLAANGSEPLPPPYSLRKWNGTLGQDEKIWLERRERASARVLCRGQCWEHRLCRHAHPCTHIPTPTNTHTWLLLYAKCWVIFLWGEDCHSLKLWTEKGV